MKELTLTQGKIALVDDDDYEVLNRWKWCALKRVLRGRVNWYAVRSEAKCSFRVKARMVFMHREILGLIDPKIFGDHKNHNGLDNRKENLRSATPAQSSCNVRKASYKSSRYKGVSWCESYKQWLAAITVLGRRRFLGRFDIEEEAALAYKQATKEAHGEYACFEEAPLIHSTV